MPRGRRHSAGGRLSARNYERSDRRVAGHPGPGGTLVGVPPPGNGEPKRTGAGPAADTDRSELGRPPGLADEISELEALQPGEVLSITRSAPSYAKGWLESIHVPPGGVAEVPEYIRGTWGGGHYVLQWKKRGENSGKLVYAKGSATLTIAGEPLHQGRRYLGTQLEPPQQSTVTTQPVIVQQPAAPRGVGGDLQDLLTTLLRRAVEGKSDGGSVVELIKAIRELERDRSPAPASSSSSSPLAELDGIDRMVSMITKLRKLDPARDDDDDDDRASPPGMFGMGGSGTPSIEQLFMWKMMSEMGGGMPMPGMPGMQPMGATPQVQAPPGHVWHPQRGWIPFATPAPATPSSPATVVSAPSSTSSPPRSSVAETTAPAWQTPDDVADSEFFDGPLSADEVAEHVASLPDAERERFLLDVLAKLGIDPSMAAQAQQAFGAQPFHVTLPTGSDDERR